MIRTIRRIDSFSSSFPARKAFYQQGPRESPDSHRLLPALAYCGKTCSAQQSFDCSTSWTRRTDLRRMLKKAVQQGRSERRAETNFLTRPTPSCRNSSFPEWGYVEGLSDARTTYGKRRVSARQGWAGETSDFFSILLEKQTGHPPTADSLSDLPDYGAD
jgi:hypothetical protein